MIYRFTVEIHNEWDESPEEVKDQLEELIRGEHWSGTVSFEAEIEG